MLKQSFNRFTLYFFRKGYKCLECKIMVHKRCHKFINLQCDQILAEQQQSLASASSNHSTLSSSSANNNGNSYSVSEAKIQKSLSNTPSNTGKQQNGIKTSSPIHEQQTAKTKSSLSSSLKNNKFSSQTAALINTEKKKPN